MYLSVLVRSTALWKETWSDPVTPSPLPLSCRQTCWFQMWRTDCCKPLHPPDSSDAPALTGPFCTITVCKISICTYNQPYDHTNLGHMKTNSQKLSRPLNCDPTPIAAPRIYLHIAQMWLRAYRYLFTCVARRRRIEGAPAGFLNPPLS